MLEYLPPDRVFVDLYNPATKQLWSAILSKEEAAQFQPEQPWQKSVLLPVANKTAYARSPNADVDGRFELMSQGGLSFYLSETTVTEPVADSSGLLRVGELRKFHELTFGPGRSVSCITHEGQSFVLVSESTPSSPFGALPADWTRKEIELSDDWRILFDGTVTRIESVEDGRIYQGPVTLPGNMTP